MGKWYKTLMIQRTSLVLASTEKGISGFSEFKVFSLTSLFDNLLKTFLFVLSIELGLFIFVEGFQGTRTNLAKSSMVNIYY